MRAVLERDFLHEASRPRAVVLRTLLAAIVSLAVVLALWVARDGIGLAPDRFGTVLFTSGSLALLVLVVLLTPALVAGSILSEREEGTLPLVLATPAGAGGFAAGKLLARWAASLLLVLAALPCLAMVTLYGGISGRQLEGLAVTAAALALEMAAWSLWVSSHSRRLATAVVLAFVLPAARWWATHLLLSAFGPASGRGTADLLLSLSTPLLPTGAVLSSSLVPSATWSSPGGPGPFAGFLLEHPWFGYAGWAVVAAAAATMAARVRLLREEEPRGGFLARTAGRRRRFRGRPGSGNPVLWKESRLLNAASSRPLYYGSLALLLASFLIFSRALEDAEGAMTLLSSQVALLCLLGTVAGAASPGQERSLGTWDLLRASPLGAGEILGGKAGGIGVGLLFLAVVPAWEAFGAWHLRSFDGGMFLASLGMTLLLPATWTAIGLWSGVRSPRVRTGVVRAVAFYLAALVGLPLAGVVLALLSQGQSAFATLLVAGSPPVTVGTVLESLRERRPYVLDGERWGVSAFTWTLLNALLLVVLLRLLPRLLARRMEEDRETG